MDIFLEKFAGKIDTKSLLKTIVELKTEYLYDGITTDDFPPIIICLLIQTMKFKKLTFVHKNNFLFYTSPTPPY